MHGVQRFSTKKSETERSSSLFNSIRPFRLPTQKAQDYPRQGGALGFRHFTSSLSSLNPIDVENFLTPAIQVTNDAKLEEELKTQCKLLENLIHHRTNFPYGTNAPKENQKIPAGYTYLLQFMAHDIIASTFPIAQHQDPSTISGQARYIPLRLETLYGQGPEIQPLAYNFVSEGMRRSLRLGVMKGNQTKRDIPRQAIYEHDTNKDKNRKEVLIADVRNDNNGIISQLTTVFIFLHNYIISTLETLLENNNYQSFAATKEEASIEIFVVAKEITTLIYRNIIRQDVMKRVLHPDIYSLYAVHYPKFIDKAYYNQDLRPVVEFGFAAFRFAHSMVRGNYKFRKDDHSIQQVLGQTSSIAGATQIPPQETWIAKWSNFFEIDNSTPQQSMAIGLFSNLMQLGKIDESNATSLPYRDFLSGGLVRLLKTTHLIDVLKQAYPTLLTGKLYDSQKELPKLIEEWLASQSKNPFGQTVVPEQLKCFLINHTPLLFFILFEAESREQGGGQGGTNLGLLGSILVADHVFGMLYATPVTDKDLDFNAAIREIILKRLGEAGLAPLKDVLKTQFNTMPELLKFIAKFCKEAKQGPEFL